MKDIYTALMNRSSFFGFIFFHVLMTPPWKKEFAAKSKEAKERQAYLRRNGKHLKDLRIGSWNVLSLFQPAALRMLLVQLDRYELDITAIQEIRWAGEGIIEKKDHTVFYSCQKKEKMFGTAFTLNKKKKSYYGF
jgi:hypothetical protein